MHSFCPLKEATIRFLVIWSDFSVDINQLRMVSVAGNNKEGEEGYECSVHIFAQDGQDEKSVFNETAAYAYRHHCKRY